MSAKIDLDKLTDDYHSGKSKYADLVGEVRHTLRKKIDENGIRTHAITSRVKELPSIVKKCEEKDISNPLSDLSDIAGIRVVCLFRSDLELVEKIIIDVFDVIEIDNKIISGDGYGYMSIHYTCKLSGNYKGDRYDHIKEIIFEIQTRTLCMDAWASISHYLSYKGEWDVPKNLKQAMNALSGLFYVADNEFMQVYNDSQKSKDKSKQSIESQSDKDIPINFDTIQAYMNDKFKERAQVNDGAISDIVHQIIASGYDSIGDVSEDVDNASRLFNQYEAELIATKKLKHQFSRLGALRVTLAIASERMEKFRSKDPKRGSYDEVASKYRDKYLKEHKDRSLE